MSADVITELDVIDPEIAVMRAWVYCEDCDEVAEAIDMARQHDGAWLCWTCENRDRREYEEQRQYLARNVYGY
jgi:formylmethanofuran dehydrogenase subunit E